MESIWVKTAEQRRFPALSADRETEVLIIGGGLCGLLCARALHEAGVDYLLLEAETLCGGITKNTTAKITSQHGLIYHKLLSRFGEKKARLYYDINERALSRYAALCEGLDCDFARRDAYVYSLADRKSLMRELDALKRLHISADYCEQLPLPFPTAGAVRFPNEAEFHPLKFAYAIAEGLHIFEHTRVRELVGTTAVTSGGKVKAKKIIVATHFPFLNKHGSYFLKLYQSRSYVLALRGAQQAEGMYVDEADRGLSFRNYNDLLLLGGGGHRTGKRGGGYAELRAFAKKYYPEAEEVCRFATQDCMTLDGVPYIGEYSMGTKGLFVATGFNKWGMTSSMVAATLLSDLVRGKKPPERVLFSPSRSILRPQLALNAFEAVTSILTPSKKRCPHLGCALKWNPEEHTWDCPCHGSRFTKDGKLIDNPATGDLKE